MKTKTMLAKCILAHRRYLRFDGNSHSLNIAIYRSNTMSNDNICDWLRDAHAMEEQAEKLFHGQASRLKAYSELSAKLEEEVTFIEANKMLLSDSLKKLGSCTSVVKDSFGKFIGFEQNMAGIMVSDEPVKGILALHTFSQMAVGSYKILV